MNEEVVAVKCFYHPVLGNVHVGEALTCCATVMVRNKGDKVPVRRVKEGLVEACLIRKQMKR